MTSNLSISRVLIGVYGVISLCALVILFSLMSFLQEHSVNKIAQDHAEEQAGFIFESLYTVMRKGTDKDELDDIIHRLSLRIPDMKIALIRSEAVADLYGDNDIAKHRRAFDEDIQKSFETKRSSISKIGKQHKFIYPILTQDECLACHDNVASGDVNGVMEIIFPTQSIALPLGEAMNMVALICAILFLFLFVLTVFCLHMVIVKPVRHLAQDMKEIQKGNSFSVETPCRIKEIESLRLNFSELMAHLKEAHQELEELTIKDPLTGLYNRRHLEDVLSREMERAERYRHIFSIIMIDLDKFKPINDTYGHDAGDFVLKRVSQTLQENLRTSDVLARVGGDEFQVLVPDQDHEHCEKLIEKLRMALESLEMEYKGQSLSISSSFGVATFGVDGKDLITLERHADETMYADKKRRKMGR